MEKKEMKKLFVLFCASILIFLAGQALAVAPGYLVSAHP
jgi:hypothetical protein